jgi:hypothetical protein
LSWVTVAAAELPDRLAAWLAGTPGVVRVAVDGAPSTDPDALALSLLGPLRARGRPAAHVRADRFWRDASVRLEPGREDVESYLNWLDDAALRREVLEAGDSYLPSLRDPATNRSTREPVRPLEPGTVLLVSGALLLGRGLPFDRTIHLTLSRTVLAQRTPGADAWTLPAFERYDATVRPVTMADVVIRPGRPDPAVRRLPSVRK